VLLEINAEGFLTKLAAKSDELSTEYGRRGRELRQIQPQVQTQVQPLTFEGEAQEDFLGEHPELEIDPRDQWLRDNPKQNAQLALWGQAKPMSLEAYDLMADMARELDVPDNAIPEYMPRNIFELDLQYQEVPLGNARLIFRHENPEYEKYLVEEKGYTPVGDRWQGATPSEKPGTYVVPPK